MTPWTAYLRVRFVLLQCCMIPSTSRQGGRIDFIQLMIQAHDREVEHDTELEVNADADVDNEQDDDGDDDKEATVSPSTTAKLGLTMEEMQANSFILMIAGYETTSTALAFTAHELALHPDIQKKLQEEIDEYFPEVR